MPRVKQFPEDFIVREVFEKQQQKEGWRSEDESYVWFDLTKRDCDFFRCLKILSRRLGVSPKRFGYAGVKDKRAVTTQKISVWNVPMAKLEGVRLRDIELSNFEEAKERINLGDLKANRFEITIRDIREVETQNIIENLERIKKNGFVNYFGGQRFGNRGNTHLVGREILRNDLKEAVWLYLAGGGDEKDDITSFRRRLKESGDLKAALKECPTILRNEIIMLNHLVRVPTDYAGALRRLPKKFRMMLVHAYQSHLWNEMARGTDADIVPLIGYNTDMSKFEAKELFENVLEKENVKITDFKIQSMPELSCEGGERERIALAAGLRWGFIADDLTEGRMKCVLNFEIPKGAYATVLLDEVLGLPKVGQ
jgi:tRNA pseudouridine13 synthase